MWRCPRALPFALATLLLASPRAGSAEEKLVDGIAAQVGSEIVLISDVNQAAQSTVTKLKAQGATPQQLAMLRAEVLEQMIERALLRQLVKRADLGASDAEVDEAIQRIAQQNKISLQQLKASVAAQGMPYQAYRDRIRDNIEHTKVVSTMVASKVDVKEEEVRALYDKELGNQPKGGEEYLLAHILLTWRGNESHDSTCALVDQARKRIAKGEAFKDVAKAVSENNPERGGLIGWIHESKLASWMKPVVAHMQAGQVSNVIRTSFGCNLLMVVRRRAFKPISFEEAKGPLRKKLWNERVDKEYTKFIAKLREKTYIERKGVFADASHLDPNLATDRPSGAPAF